MQGILKRTSKICTVDELCRIEVINLDAWVMQFMREQGFSIRSYNNQLEEIWENAIALAGDTTGFTMKFYLEAWLKVISPGSIQESYMKASRIGRHTP